MGPWEGSPRKQDAARARAPDRAMLGIYGHHVRELQSASVVHPGYIQPRRYVPSACLPVTIMACRLWIQACPVPHVIKLRQQIQA
jgi:hypothetical protein